MSLIRPDGPPRPALNSSLAGVASGNCESSISMLPPSPPPPDEERRAAQQRAAVEIDGVLALHVDHAGAEHDVAAARTVERGGALGPGHDQRGGGLFGAAGLEPRRRVQVQIAGGHRQQQILLPGLIVALHAAAARSPGFSGFAEGG
jgi:hypothetical protein